MQLIIRGRELQNIHRPLINGTGVIVLVWVSSMNEKRSLMKTIWDRNKNWIGHVVKGDGYDEIGA